MEPNQENKDDAIKRFNQDVPRYPNSKEALEEDLIKKWVGGGNSCITSADNREDTDYQDNERHNRKEQNHETQLAVISRSLDQTINDPYDDEPPPSYLPWT